MSIVITPNNMLLKKEFQKLCDDLGTKPMFREFNIMGRTIENYDYLMNSFSNDITNKQVPLSDEYKSNIRSCSCGAGDFQLSILPDGSVVPCDLFWQNEFIFCNLNEIDSLYKFIKSGAIYKNSAYNALKEYEPDKNDICKNCNINLFCWTCPNTIYKNKSDPNAIKRFCSGRKEYLTKEIWG